MSIERFEKEIRELLESDGFEVVEFRVERRSKFDIAKIFVDTDNGVMIEECTKASKMINNYLFENEYNGKDYRLEVSSPGLDRPLKTPRDFRKKLDKKVEVVYQVDNNSRTVQGKLTGVTDEHVTLINGKEEISIPFEDLDQGKVVLPW